MLARQQGVRVGLPLLRRRGPFTDTKDSELQQKGGERESVMRCCEGESGDERARTAF